jgi:hypothetical protein
VRSARAPAIVPSDATPTASALSSLIRHNPRRSLDAFHLGTWKLVHATARDAAGAARPSPYGGKMLGRVTFTADGRVMSVVCDGRRKLPAGVSREYSSYCGSYTYDEEKVVAGVDAASDPSRIGSDQLRGVRFEGERMVLILPPRRACEIEEHREITWERIAGG